MLLKKSIILFIIMMNTVSSFFVVGCGCARNNNIKMCSSSNENKTLKEQLEEKQRKYIQKKNEAGMDLRFRVEAPKIFDDIDVVVDDTVVKIIELFEKKEKLKILLSCQVPEIIKLELIRNSEPPAPAPSIQCTAVLNSTNLMNTFLCNDW